MKVLMSAVWRTRSSVLRTDPHPQSGVERTRCAGPSRKIIRCIRCGDHGFPDRRRHHGGESHPRDEDRCGTADHRHHEDDREHRRFPFCGQSDESGSILVLHRNIRATSTNTSISRRISSFPSSMHTINRSSRRNNQRRRGNFFSRSNPHWIQNRSSVHRMSPVN